MNSLFHYEGYGLRIDSELELPELAVAPESGADADIVIRLRPIPRIPRKTTLDEELAINIVGAAYLIRDGREITVDPRPHANPQAVRIALLGRVMGFLMRQRGWLPLHASGVVVKNARGGQSCALFLGASGAGKSTLAAAFHRAGHLVITDDVGAARMDRNGSCVVQPSWSYVRLHEESRPALGAAGLKPGLFQADKHRYDLGIPLGRRYRLSCAYVVEWGAPVNIEPIPALQAITMLSKYSFVRHPTMERLALERHLQDCAAVAGGIPVRRLIRPRSLSALLEVVRLVEQDLAELDNEEGAGPESACETAVKTRIGL